MAVSPASGWQGSSNSALVDLRRKVCQPRRNKLLLPTSDLTAAEILDLGESARKRKQVGSLLKYRGRSFVDFGGNTNFEDQPNKSIGYLIACLPAEGTVSKIIIS
jgi:hypothetical protein